jgi:hypothetical protein
MDGNTLHYDDKGNWHRDGGPAAIWGNGTQAWYQHGKLHREDGPALELASGKRRWFYQGKELYVSSLEEFQKYINNKAFW